MISEDSFDIIEIGARGDGVALSQEGRVYVPGALPGERWQKLPDGRVQCAGAVSENRRVAPCPHFEKCGGCRVQHMAPELYKTWKCSLVKSALRHHGVEAEIEPLWSAPEHSRRRAKFQFKTSQSAVELGFHEAGTHAIVNMDSCLVLDRSIVMVLPILRRALQAISGSGTLAVTVLDQGLAVGIQSDLGEIPASLRRSLVEVTGGTLVHWLSVNDEVIFARHEPVVTVNGATLSIVPDAFLQAVPAAEVQMADRIGQATRRAKSVADLFCGVGTLTFPLAKHSSVSAFDSGKVFLETLAKAVRTNKGFKPIDVCRRNLFEDPLSVRELDAFDAVVLDPPRAGAAAQAKRLARSNVGVVVMVSCQPATFARDARTLIEGGYRLRSVLPIDQFLFTEHLEVVGVFQRSRASPKRRST